MFRHFTTPKTTPAKEYDLQKVSLWKFPTPMRDNFQLSFSVLYTVMYLSDSRYLFRILFAIPSWNNVINCWYGQLCFIKLSLLNWICVHVINKKTLKENINVINVHNKIESFINVFYVNILTFVTAVFIYIGLVYSMFSCAIANHACYSL